jgi:hypothetical protein
MSDKQQLLEQRRERVLKTFRREKTDKVPFLFCSDSYVPYYAGIPLQEIQTFDQALEANRITNEDLQYDCIYAPYMPQNLILTPKLSLLEGGAHVVGDNYVKQVVPSSIKIFEPEEYPELIKDPINYLLETVFPRRHKLLAGKDPEKKFRNIVQLFGMGQQLSDYLAKCETECGLPVLLNGIYYFNPVDVIFDLLRDFTGIISDVKRCPKLLRDAGLAMVDGVLKMTSLQPPDSYRAIVCPMHLPAFLRPKDFEKVYWPSFKKLTEGIVAQGHNVMFYFEKNYSHLYDYLQELPSHNVSGIFEEDDIRVVKQKLGNRMTIAGGLSTNLLYYGTKQECIDHVKGLIDDVAPGGGYFIAPDTPLLFPVDAKPENLKAVADFINDYGRNK